VRYGKSVDRDLALQLLAEWANPADHHFVTMAALTSLNNLGDAAKPVHKILRQYPLESVNLPHPRYRNYVPKLISDTLDSKVVEPKR